MCNMLQFNDIHSHAIKTINPLSIIGSLESIKSQLAAGNLLSILKLLILTSMLLTSGLNTCITGISSRTIAKQQNGRMDIILITCTLLYCATMTLT